VVIKRGTNGTATHGLAALTRPPEDRRGTRIAAAAALLVALAGGAEAATKIGTAGNDTLNGTALADILAGRAGNDTLNGLAGADKLYGDTENDRLFGGDGNDLLYGGPGNDAHDGGSGDDRLTGQEGRDVLRGGSGNDALYGGPDAEDSYEFDGIGEADVLYGGPGNDAMDLTNSDVGYGGDGADTISVCGAVAYGEGGNDRFLPIACNNNSSSPESYYEGEATLRGGLGSDTLVLTTPPCGNLWVTFVGWEPGVDRLEGDLWTTRYEEGEDSYCVYGQGTPYRIGPIKDYLLQHLDTNHDRHISKADGPTFLVDGSNLTFPTDPTTGKQSLRLQLFGGDLYLPDVTTLF
jgi:Ca2+-binding RTX toxin-like protein